MKERILKAGVCVFLCILSYGCKVSEDDSSNLANSSAPESVEPSVKTEGSFPSLTAAYARAKAERLAKKKISLNNDALSRGYYLINPGFIGTASEIDLDSVSQAIAAEDKESLTLMFAKGRAFRLGSGLPVDLVGESGLFGSKVKLRVRKTGQYVWTFREAIL